MSSNTRCIKTFHIYHDCWGYIIIQILRWYSAARDQLGQLTPGKLRQLCGLVRAGGAAGRSWCGQQQPGRRQSAGRSSAAHTSTALHCTAPPWPHSDIWSLQWAMVIMWWCLVQVDSETRGDGEGGLCEAGRGGRLGGEWGSPNRNKKVIFSYDSHIPSIVAVYNVNFLHSCVPHLRRAVS